MVKKAPKRVRGTLTSKAAPDAATKAKLLPIGQLRAAPWNPRKIQRDRMESLKRSIVADPDFLLLRPILALPDGTVYAGNQRLEAARQLGLAEVPVIISDIPEVLAKERGLKDNNTYGDWVEEDLSVLVEKLRIADVDVVDLGFDAKALKELLPEPDPKPEPTEPDFSRARELGAKWGTKVGQVWQAGRHRLAVGDCCDKALVNELMQGVKADAVVTDPPYGTGNDQIPSDEYLTIAELYVRSLNVAPITDGQCIAFQATRYFPMWIDALKQNGFCFDILLWMKSYRGTCSWHGWLLKSHAIVVGSKGASRYPDLDRYSSDTYILDQSTEISVDNKVCHIADKPLWVVEDLVAHTSGIVYDGFVGGGTTIVACERQNRQCYAVELSPDYAGVTLERLADIGLEVRCGA